MGRRASLLRWRRKCPCLLRKGVSLVREEFFETQEGRVERSCSRFQPDCLACGGCCLGWLEFRGVVEGRSAEPTEQDVAAARGRGADGLVVHLVFGTFAIAVGLRSSVLGFECREDRKKQRASEDLDVLPRGTVAPYGGPRYPGGRDQPGMESQVSCSLEIHDPGPR